MDSEYAPGTPTSDTSYVLLNIDVETLLDRPMNTDDFITAQQNYHAYQNFTCTVGMNLSQLKYDNLGFLVRTFKLYRALQRVVPTSLRAKIM